ncbi:MAG: hypothetical protein DI534_01455 [Leifsonia xyli]|jgi:hypothetical protein|nr:MAG: hypothetical protein DI534_01455 [Leifsonia xyli]
MNASRPVDSVVIYDLLVESRARLVGAYNVAIDDDDAFVALVHELDKRIDGVDVADSSSQFELIRRFNAEALEVRRMNRQGPRPL